MAEKQCTKCSDPKPLKDFYPRKNSRDGRRAECIACSRRLVGEYRKTPRGKATAKRSRRAQRARAYGLTPAEHEVMERAQNGCCAICGRKETAKLKGKTLHLSIDHSHKTGKVRALLCRKCNSLLGYVSDSIETLRAAIQYLEKYGE